MTDPAALPARARRPYHRCRKRPAAGQNWKDAAIFPVIPQSALRATLGILARTVARTVGACFRLGD